MQKSTLNIMFAAVVAAILAMPANAAKYYANCFVESVPSMDNGGGGAWVTKDLFNAPDPSDYKTEDNSTSSANSLGTSAKVTFYAYRPGNSVTFEFIGWNTDKSTPGSSISDTSVGNNRYMTTYQISSSSKDSSSPATDRIYAHYHVHAKAYVLNANGVTIDYMCTNDTTTCKNSCGSSYVTITANNKVCDGSPYAPTLVGDIDSATLTYFDGETAIAAPSDVGSYSVKMTYGDKSITKNFTITPSDVPQDVSSTAVLSLSSTDLKYSGGSQQVLITSLKVGDTDIPFDEASDSVRSASAIGTYTAKVNAKGNYTGTISASWKISDYSGSFASDAFTTDASGCEAVDDTVTVTNPAKLAYVANNTWRISSTLTWPRTFPNASLSQDDPDVLYIDEDHAIIEALDDSTTLDIKVRQYTVPLIGNVIATHNYIDTLSWHIDVTIDDITNAIARSEQSLDYLLYVGARDWTHYTTGISMTTYVMTLPLENIVLTDTYGHQIYPEPDHVHACEFAAAGSRLVATCTNETGACELAGRTTSIDLMATGGADGVAPTLSISNRVDFLAAVNLVSDVATIGEISAVRLTDDGAACENWYVGNYRATCPVTIEGSSVLTLTNDFSIAKPSGGYTSGWAVGSRDIRYTTWEEALSASADSDIIYYRDGDRDFTTHEFSVGSKSLTIDFNGAKLTRADELGNMTIKNAGSGELTLQNVTLLQPKGFLVSFQISAEGTIVFGTGVKTINQATNTDRYLKITVSDGTLVVTNGLYQNSFANSSTGTYCLRGGKYNSTYGEPTADDGYVVRVIEGEYDREIVPHTHLCSYSAETNVISATCITNDHEFCGFGTQTATLLAPNMTDNGSPYNLAEIEYSDLFLDKSGTIAYFDGETEIGAPSAVGSYTAKLTIGGATAVKDFEILHAHVFEYDADQSAGTISARCTRMDDCDFNLNPRVATLSAQNGTFSGFAQDLASVVTNAVDFPTNIVLNYSCEGKPVNAGSYTATMTAADKCVSRNFSIARAQMSSTTLSLTSDSLYYNGTEQSVGVGSVKLGDYTLVEGVDYTNSAESVYSSAGSGASNVTMSVTVLGNGNFADGPQTANWTIVAPTRDFVAVEKYGETGGTIDGSRLTMDGSNWVYFAAANAPDGSGVAGWYAALRLSWPVDETYYLQFTRDEAALHTLSTQPGEQFWANDLSGAVGLSAYTANALLSQVKYIKYTYWWSRLTPADVESCNDAAVVRSMTACGIRWSKSGSIYGDNDGVKEITCEVTQPLDDLTLEVPAGETYDLGATRLDRTSLKLGANAQVSTSVEQDWTRFSTDVAGYSVVGYDTETGWLFCCVPTASIVMKFELGNVRQRYPFNTIVDVPYRVTRWVANSQLKPAIVVKVGEKAVTNMVDFAGRIGNFTGSTTFDINTIAPNSRGKAKFKTILLPK